MRVLHGRGLARARPGPPGRPSHVLITGACSPRPGWRRPAAPRRAHRGAVAAAGTAQFAGARIAPGPKTAREIATMTVTSLVIPELACWH